jgi:hypothetical protein
MGKPRSNWKPMASIRVFWSLARWPPKRGDGNLSFLIAPMCLLAARNEVAASSISAISVAESYTSQRSGLAAMASPTQAEGISIWRGGRVAISGMETPCR